MNTRDHEWERRPEDRLDIRPAKEEDLTAILDILDAARGIMRASGNPTQWVDGYPSAAAIRSDIAKGGGMLVTASVGEQAGGCGEQAGGCGKQAGGCGKQAGGCGKQAGGCGERPVGYFAFLPSPEPTYARIDGGTWLDDRLPYHVIHRIASYPEVHGVFDTMLRWAGEREGNLRIDTHRDNRIKQHLLKKHGFQFCGIIYLTSGDERLAYQRLGEDG
ncbi:MAG: N-acetyltransferase [Bacteroidales bacterium]|nr:N-acetyltransferase [Bacteroidales bacterium]